MRSMMIVAALMTPVLALGCATQSSDDAVAGEAQLSVPEGENAVSEYVCILQKGRQLTLDPKNGEIEDFNVNTGKWTSQDGLAFNTSSIPHGSKLEVVGESGTVGILEELPDGISYVTGSERGTCKRFDAQKFMSMPFELTAELRYTCSVGATRLVIRPSFGEIDEIDVREGISITTDGLDFRLRPLALERADLREGEDLKNEIRATDEEGNNAGILREDAVGAVWTTSEGLQGQCVKWRATSP